MRLACDAVAVCCLSLRVAAASPPYAAETDVNSLFPQRRRWTNGSIAGFLQLVGNHSIWKSVHPTPRKLFMYFAVIMQLMIYFLFSLAPGIFAYALQTSLPLTFPFADPMWQYVVVALYWALYLAFVIRHAIDIEPNIEQSLVYMGMLANVFTVAITVRKSVME